MAMKRVKKWRICAAVLAVLAVAGAAAYILARYFNYDAYKRYLRSAEPEEGGEFVPISEPSPDVPGMVLAAENGELKLYTDLKTSEIAVYEKKTGHITYSNPVDREEDTIAAGVNAQLLSSTINLIYYSSTMSRGTMNNYNMSIQYGQFEVEALENGIRYIYTLRDPANSTGIVPLRISEERMQTIILDKLEAADARTVRSYFTLEDGFYTLNEAAKKSRVGINRLNRFFESCGYTQEDYDLDMEGIEGDGNISFVVPLEYRLTENGLEASVPTGEIREGGGASIVRLQLLPMFGAAGTDAQGYIFVPDGSGALIYLNNGTRDAPYAQNVYGIDPVVQSYIVTDITETVRLPVFGMKNGGAGFLARITGGDALSSVNAQVAGNTNCYNFAYAEFSLREYELLNMFGVTGTQADVPTVEDGIYGDTLAVTYTFLSGGDADYSGMANAYRGQLIAEGVLREGGTGGGDIPLYLDILGGVETKKHILGVPYRGVSVMTTYGQANEILDMLYQGGVGKVRMSYLGWFNRGVYHDVPDRVELIGALGGKDELEELAARLEENGGRLSLDVAFQQAAYTSRRFSSLLEASKYYSGYVVKLGALNPATMRQTSDLGWYDELTHYIVSPKFLPRYVSGFEKSIAKYDVSGITLRDLGDVLASDKKRTEVIHRQMAEDVVKGQLEELRSLGMDLTVKGGNAYSLGYVTDILDAPVMYSRFYIVDEQVPFYEMVVHGSVDYTGQALNLMDKDVDETMLLELIEYGAAPRFTMSYEDSDDIKYTSSADMYSVCYTTWIEDAQRIYNQLNQVLSCVEGASMVRHEKLENGLVRVSYSNGVTVYVNKTESAIQSGGISVDAMSCGIVRGEA